MTVDSSSATATAGVASSRAQIAGAIKQAANTTGTSFQYLLTTAKMESDFNPKAQASTSSAAGLFQFIDQTWLGTVKEAGAQLGYGQYADAITKSSSGDYSVSDPAAQTAIMKLRDDPVASSAMAGVLTQSNSFKLTGLIGRRPTDGELYMAHFMGVSGAGKLITNAEDNPQASGARMFPNAAAANRSIFYDSSGRARSVSEVYSVLTSRYAAAANSPATRTAMAAVGDTPATTAVASAGQAAAPMDNAAYLSTFPNAAAAARGYDGVGFDHGRQFDGGRYQLPLAVSGRRTLATGLAGGAEIVGRIRLADIGCGGQRSTGGASVRRQRVARARSLQRSQRHVQQLNSLPARPRRRHP